LLDNNDMAKFTANISSGTSVGFSGIPGKGNYTVDFGKQFARSFNKQKNKTKQGTAIVDPPKTPSTTPPSEPTAIQDPVKTPVKRMNKGKEATTADVERAVSAGFITPEEATGGEWGKSASLSSTYSKKSAANAAANNGTNVGKQFTGVRAGQPIPDQSGGAMNYGKAPRATPPPVTPPTDLRGM
jgi:hypothetical protein